MLLWRRGTLYRCPEFQNILVNRAPIKGAPTKLIKHLFFLLLLFNSLACFLPRKKFLPEEEVFVEQKVKLLLAQGNKFLLKKDTLNLAKASYQVARELKPNDPRVIDGLGAVAWREGEIELALYYFKRAYSFDSKYDRPLVHLALIAEKRGDLFAAKELLLKAIEINPLNYRAKNNLAVLIKHYEKDPDKKGLTELYQAYALAGKDDPVLNYNFAKEKEKITHDSP